MIAQPVAVRSYPCATLMTLWFWSRYKGGCHCGKIRVGGILSPDYRARIVIGKDKVTSMTEGFEFLGFRFGMRWDKRYGYFPRVQIPKAKAGDLRERSSG